MCNPTLAAVIVSYNTVALLHDCLASLASCRLPLRVVVVDNASRDGSAALVRATFPAVELIEAGGNLGFAGGTNLGLAALGALPDYLLVLNPDTVVHPGAVEAMVAFLEQHPRVGLVGPRLLNPDGTPQPAAFRFPTLAMAALDLFPPGEVLPGRLYGSWWHGRYPQDGGEVPFPLDHPLGACMVVRGETLALVGPLDAGYFMYSEEIEWCWRIRRAGWAIWQVPAAKVTHVGGAATRQFRHKMLVALWRSRDRFAAVSGPPWRHAAHRALVRAGMLRLALASWCAYGRGDLSRDELRARLLAYGEITRL
jgi:GT2 family glycosyltransferase